jgi:hypothetical protein
MLSFWNKLFFVLLIHHCENLILVKQKKLLVKNGKLVGVSFAKEFEAKGPPFGVSTSQYIPLFENDFSFRVFETYYNSFLKRMDTELFKNLLKK